MFERAEISKPIKIRWFSLILQLIDSSNSQKQARHESNRQLLFTLLITIVMELVVLVVTSSTVKKTSPETGVSMAEGIAGSRTSTEEARNGSGTEEGKGKCQHGGGHQWHWHRCWQGVVATDPTNTQADKV